MNRYPSVGIPSSSSTSVMGGPHSYAPYPHSAAPPNRPRINPLGDKSSNIAAGSASNGGSNRINMSVRTRRPSLSTSGSVGIVKPNMQTQVLSQASSTPNAGATASTSYSTGGPTTICGSNYASGSGGGSGSQPINTRTAKFSSSSRNHPSINGHVNGSMSSMRSGSMGTSTASSKLPNTAPPNTTTFPLSEITLNNNNKSRSRTSSLSPPLPFVGTGGSLPHSASNSASTSRQTTPPSGSNLSEEALRRHQQLSGGSFPARESARGMPSRDTGTGRNGDGSGNRRRASSRTPETHGRNSVDEVNGREMVPYDDGFRIEEILSDEEDSENHEQSTNGNRRNSRHGRRRGNEYEVEEEEQEMQDDDRDDRGFREDTTRRYGRQQEQDRYGSGGSGHRSSRRPSHHHPYEDAVPIRMENGYGDQYRSQRFSRSQRPNRGYSSRQPPPGAWDPYSGAFPNSHTIENEEPPTLHDGDFHRGFPPSPEELSDMQGQDLEGDNTDDEMRRNRERDSRNEKKAQIIATMLEKQSRRRQPEMEEDPYDSLPTPTNPHFEHSDDYFSAKPTNDTKTPLPSVERIMENPELIRQLNQIRGILQQRIAQGTAIQIDFDYSEAIAQRLQTVQERLIDEGGVSEDVFRDPDLYRDLNGDIHLEPQRGNKQQQKSKSAPAPAPRSFSHIPQPSAPPKIGSAPGSRSASLDRRNAEVSDGGSGSNTTESSPTAQGKTRFVPGWERYGLNVQSSSSSQSTSNTQSNSNSASNSNGKKKVAFWSARVQARKASMSTTMNPTRAQSQPTSPTRPNYNTQNNRTRSPSPAFRSSSQGQSNGFDQAQGQQLPFPHNRSWGGSQGMEFEEPFEDGDDNNWLGQSSAHPSFSSLPSSHGSRSRLPSMTSTSGGRSRHPSMTRGAAGGGGISNGYRHEEYDIEEITTTTTTRKIRRSETTVPSYGGMASNGIYPSSQRRPSSHTPQPHPHHHGHGHQQINPYGEYEDPLRTSSRPNPRSRANSISLGGGLSSLGGGGGSGGVTGKPRKNSTSLGGVPLDDHPGFSVFFDPHTDKIVGASGGRDPWSSSSSNMNHGGNGRMSVSGSRRPSVAMAGGRNSSSRGGFIL